MNAGWPSSLAIRARMTEGGAALTEGFAIGVGWLMLFALLGSSRPTGAPSGMSTTCDCGRARPFAAFDRSW